MATTQTETLVCSILFLDLTDYSKQSVTEQIRLKHLFNDALSQALVQVSTRDRLIIDTGDGAAISFPGDPESALLVALAMLDHVQELPLRMGINLGPVHRLQDLNGNENLVGDGINVAQRIMSFANPGQLLVSRSYYEVVARLSRDYEKLFTPGGPRTDKHVREHEVYAISEAVSAGRRLAEIQAQFKSRPAAQLRPVGAVDAPASVFDAGTHVVVSGTSQASVEQTLQRLLGEGFVALTAPAQVGSKWIASCGHSTRAEGVTVEQFGMQRMISGRSREAVEDKVNELIEYGAKLLTDIECVDGVWTAICETR